jgi:hypothetical protein
MASKIMIIKQTRPSLDVEFFTITAESKAALKAEPLPIIIGERNIDNGLKKIRTMFFTNAKALADWQASELVQSGLVARDAYNAEHGIATEIHTVDLPNYNPFKAPV